MRYLVLNWKMNLDRAQSILLARSIKALQQQNKTKTIICPSFSSLHDVSRTIISSRILLGAQNCFWKNEGAFTGEESPKMLYSLGCRYVLIGHSERRLLGETNKDIEMKIQTLTNTKSSLIPILCIGETKDERNTGETVSVLMRQLSILRHLALKSIIIAYEPIWAISTSANAHGALQSEDCAETIVHIRTILRSYTNKRFADAVPILYGGSVDKSNVKDILSKTSTNGLLVGRAGLRFDSIKRIHDAMI